MRATDGGAVLEVAGLARSDDPALEEDVHALASSLSTAQDGTGDGEPRPDAAPAADGPDVDGTEPHRPPRATDDPSEGSAP